MQCLNIGPKNHRTSRYNEFGSFFYKLSVNIINITKYHDLQRGSQLE